MLLVPTMDCDNSTETYKIVVFNPQSYEVRVFNFIQSFPVVPFDDVPESYYDRGVYAYVNDSLNWLAIREESQYVIISLDLSSETYRQLLPPQDFDDKMSLVVPTLAVLMDSLCFCYDFNGTNFIIWQMKEFGVQESWIQLLVLDRYCSHYVFMRIVIHWYWHGIEVSKQFSII
jgi:F-box interacting protein